MKQAMKADLYPFLTDIERDLDNPFSTPKGPWWGLGDDARNKSINATITGFDKKLENSSADELTAYAEGLKSHLVRALDCSEVDILSDYEKVIVYCHNNLTFAFFALIVRAYHKKRLPFNTYIYVSSAGIKDTSILYSSMSEIVHDWGIISNPPVCELLRRTDQTPSRNVILSNNTAISILKKMQKIGLLDRSYQWRTTDEEGRPEHHTNYEKAVFALYIYNKCYPLITEWDKAFCDLWGLRRRCLSKAHADLQTKSFDTIERYNKLLSLLDPLE